MRQRGAERRSVMNMRYSLMAWAGMVGCLIFVLQFFIL